MNITTVLYSVRAALCSAKLKLSRTSSLSSLLLNLAIALELMPFAVQEASPRFLFLCIAAAMTCFFFGIALAWFNQEIENVLESAISTIDEALSHIEDH